MFRLKQQTGRRLGLALGAMRRAEIDESTKSDGPDYAIRYRYEIVLRDWEVTQRVFSGHEAVYEV